MPRPFALGPTSVRKLGPMPRPFALSPTSVRKLALCRGPLPLARQASGSLALCRGPLPLARQASGSLARQASELMNSAELRRLGASVERLAEHVRAGRRGELPGVLVD